MQKSTTLCTRPEDLLVARCCPSSSFLSSHECNDSKTICQTVSRFTFQAGKEEDPAVSLNAPSPSITLVRTEEQKEEKKHVDHSSLRALLQRTHTSLPRYSPETNCFCLLHNIRRLPVLLRGATLAAANPPPPLLLLNRCPAEKLMPLCGNLLLPLQDSLVRPRFTWPWQSR